MRARAFADFANVPRGRCVGDGNASSQEKKPLTAFVALEHQDFLLWRSPCTALARIFGQGPPEGHVATSLVHALHVRSVWCSIWVLPNQRSED
jgi:hypothetical protein